MKLYYLSDLHLELNNFALHNIFVDPDGILLVAGDIIIAEYLNPISFSKNYKAKENFTRFLERISGFEKCIFVLGSNEHYNGFYEATYSLFYNELKSINPHKFFLLENEHFKLNEKNYIVGSTFWSNKNMKYAASTIKMRDGLLTETIISDLHKQSSDFIISFCKEMDRKNIIALTHFPPDENIILENQNLNFWIHGHIHEKTSYNLEQCQVLCNSMGYNNLWFEEKTAKDFFNMPLPYFEIED